MPDSLITKRALASSLKELMKTQPLTKISVGDICEKCGMNRKSFYYHFCDKYDLVNWIFDTEFRFATARIILRTLKRYANIFIPTASFIAARSR